MTRVREAKQPRLVKVEMTPELADELLSLNTHNRHIRDSRVRAYARDMAAGKWLETGDTLKVSSPPTYLLDGQHRVLAYKEALKTNEDTSVVFWIAYDLSERAQDATDGGIKRNLADVLSLRKPKPPRNPAALAATLRIVNAWQAEERRGLGRQGLATNATLLELFRQMPELEDITADAVIDATKCPLTPSVLALTRWLFSGVDEATNDAEEFFKLLVSDGSLVKGHPIYELRRSASRVRDEAGRGRQAKLVALTIKAWNLWRQGQVLGDAGLLFRMGGANAEKFPEPV